MRPFLSTHRLTGSSIVWCRALPFGPNPIDQATHKIISRQTPLHGRTNPVDPATEIGKHAYRSKQIGDLFPILGQTVNHPMQFDIYPMAFAPKLVQCPYPIILHSFHRSSFSDSYHLPSGTTSSRPNRQPIFSVTNRRPMHTQQTPHPSTK